MADAGALRAGLRGYCYGRSGRTRQAERLLHELRSFSATTHIPALSFAMLHIGLNDVDAALDWLDRAYDEQCGAFVWLGLEPIYDSLRTDPRFDALVRRMNFPAPRP